MSMVVLLVVCLVTSLAQRAMALEAKQVFEIASPSTVFIEDVDSFGSGVLINDKGLILTNYHVVAANISLKVRAKVKFGNRVALTELENVKVTHIHKEYDLALLQVQPPPNGSFIAARVVPQAPPVSTGARCFAIGNPSGPEGKALELTITEGLVSAAFRKVDGLEFTQISAQINPGNSGGPVCDELGQVIGIATWKMTETEGIGFAIPMQRLNMKDFIDPKTKAPNFDLAKKADEYGSKYFEMAKLASGRNRDVLLQNCSEAYRMSMLAAPNHPAPYNNLCAVYRELGNDAVAQKYAEAALRVDPTYPASCHMLGVILIKRDSKNKQVVAKSVDLWLRGLESKWVSGGQEACADDLTTTMMMQQNWPAAGYMLRWWETVVAAQAPAAAPKQGVVAQLFERVMGKPDNEGEKKRQQVLAELKQKLPAADVEALQVRKDGFTRAQFEALMAGKPLASVLGMPTGGVGAGVPAATPAGGVGVPGTKPGGTVPAGGVAPVKRP